MVHICRFSRNLWRKLPLRVLLAVSFAAVVGVAAGRTFVGIVSVVDGTSMAPTFEPGARVYTYPISTPLERGDVVVIDDGAKEYAMKRIVGLPGETVHLWRGRVFINRRLLAEPYLPKHTYTYPTARTGVFILGEGQYFVMGDNRPFSADSRKYGPIEREQIKRRVLAPSGDVRPEFLSYTIPARGKTLISPL